MFPGAVYKTSDTCNRCCVCSLASTSPKKSPSKLSKKSSSEVDNSSKKKCECICKCFGFFKHKPWDFDYKTDIPDWGEADI